MPVAYSAVTVRTASAPSRVAAMMTPNSEALVASKLWYCWAVMLWRLSCARSTAAVKPIARSAANAAVRQVEGRVRSFVHSPLRCRLIVVAGPASSGVVWVVALMSGSLGGAGELAGAIVGCISGQLEERLLQ